MKRFRIVWVVVLAGCATTQEPSSSPSTVVILNETPAASTTPAPVIEPLAPIARAGNKGSPTAAVAPVTVEKPTASAPVTKSPTATPRMSRTQFIALNDERLLDVFPGMKRRDVERHMWVAHEGKAWNPYKRETIKHSDGTRFDVLFYLTREPSPGKGVNENYLTPVIFQGEVVHAVGKYPLKKLRNHSNATHGS